MEREYCHNKFIWSIYQSFQKGVLKSYQSALRGGPVTALETGHFLYPRVHGEIPHSGGHLWLERVSPGHRQGLDVRIRAQMAIYDDTVGLQSFMQKANHISQHLSACHPAEAAHQQVSPANGSPVPEPMHVDMSRLSTRERGSRWTSRPSGCVFTALFLIIISKPVPLNLHVQRWVHSKLTLSLPSLLCWMFNYSPQFNTLQPPLWSTWAPRATSSPKTSQTVFTCPVNGMPRSSESKPSMESHLNVVVWGLRPLL